MRATAGRSSGTAWLPACALLTALIVPAAFLSGCSRDPVAKRDKYFQDALRYIAVQNDAEAIIQLQNAVQTDPAFLAGHYELGLAYTRTGHLPDAAHAFTRVLQLDSLHTEAALRLGDISLRRNERLRAEEIAKGILLREPSSAAAHDLLGRAYLVGHQLQAARVEFETARASEENNPSTHLALGVVNTGLHRFGEAQTNFRRAIELDSKRVDAYQNLSSLLVSTGRGEEAESILLQGVERNPQDAAMSFSLVRFYIRAGKLPLGLQVLDSLKRSGGESPELLEQVAGFWSSLGAFDRAILELQASLARRESESARKKLISAYIVIGLADTAEQSNAILLNAKPRDVDANIFAGAIAYLRNDLEQASTRLSKAASDDAGSVFARYFLGLTRLAQNRLPEATEEFRECLKYKSDFPHVAFRLAEISLRVGDTAGTMKQAEKLMQAHPLFRNGYLLYADAALQRKEWARAKAGLLSLEKVEGPTTNSLQRWGAIYAAEGDLRKAEDAYLRSLTVSSKPVEAILPVVRFYLERGNAQKASSTLRDVIRQGASAELYELLAELELRQARHHEAVTAAEQAISLDPTRRSPYLVIALALSAQGRLSQAEPVLERLLAVDRTATLAYVLLAEAHSQQLRPQKALEAYRRGLLADPNSAVMQAGLARLLADANGDLDYALTLAQQAKRQLPNDMVVSDVLAWVYFKKGLADMAFPIWKQCLSGQPKNAYCKFHLGMAYVDRDKKRATDMLRDSLAAGLGAPYSSEAHRQLAELHKP